MNRLIALAALIPVCSLADDQFECMAPEFKDVFLNAGMGSSTT